MPTLTKNVLVAEAHTTLWWAANTLPNRTVVPDTNAVQFLSDYEDGYSCPWDYYDPSQIISADWGDPEHGIEYVRMGTSPFGVWAELSITYEGDGEYNDLLRFWKEIPEAPVFDNETSPRVETRVGEKVACMMGDWYEN